MFMHRAIDLVDFHRSGDKCKHCTAHIKVDTDVCCTQNTRHKIEALTVCMSSTVLIVV